MDSLQARTGGEGVCETRPVKVRVPVPNVAELLRKHVADRPDRVALVDGERSVSWRELDEQVDALARGLAELGLIGGQRVAIGLSNSIEFVVCYLAVLRAGMVAVPLNPTSTAGEFARVLGDSGSRVVVVGPDAILPVRQAVGGASVPVVVAVGGPALPGERAYDDVLATAGRAVVTPRDIESLAVLLYTSGTSGRPRAAMLSHRALLANIEQTARLDPQMVSADDVVLAVLPMFHVYGLNGVLGQAIRQGASMVVCRRFDADATLDLIATAGVTSVPVAPPAIVAWLDRPGAREKLATVRALLSGAAPLSEALVRKFQEQTGVTVEQGYGLTETAPVVTSTVGTPHHKPGSIGRAIPGVEVRVVDDRGADVLGDDPGEIWVRGDNLFTGYWPDGDGGPDADGWLATGDIGFLDPDGDVFLVDRLKELVIVNGFNVYPSEIEDVIGEVAGVDECAVIGTPDEATGESVLAYVVSSGDDPAELVARIKDHCAKRLARFKQPAVIKVVDELPHSATGKVAKGRLRATQARKAMGLA